MGTSFTNIYCCLLDLKKGFDKVKFSLLFTKLLQKGMPPLFVRLLIFMYMQQSCKVRWNQTHSESFSIVNGVRQGAVLSPSLFSLYIDKLLLDLKSSGLGCQVGNHFYGASAYADDIILLSPTRSGLQDMFSMCFDYFKDHEITISTNPDAKSKTKCIYIPYGKQNTKPTPILMGEKELPWVDSRPHLGNNLHGNDFVYPGKGSMSHDLLDKRGSFIGKFHSIFQEFGFSDPQVMMRLWNYSSKEAEKLFTSWNILVRTVYKVPNTCLLYTSPSPRDS